MAIRRKRKMLGLVPPRAKRTKTIIRSSRNVLGVELKFLDCAWNGVTIANGSTDGSGAELQPSSGCTDCISVPAQGDGEQQRDGRKFTLKSIYFNGVVDTAPLQDQPDAQDAFGVFFALVLDTQANGVTINSEDVYTHPGTAATSILPQPLRNLENSKRFKVLDRMYVEPGGSFAMTDGANTGSINQQNAMSVTLSWKGNLPCVTKGTTANISSASDNAVHVVAYTAGTQTKVFQGKSRVRFVG